MAFRRKRRKRGGYRKAKPQYVKVSRGGVRM